MSKATPLLSNKVCLVTGGKGFIGSHLVDALLTNSNTVVVLDNEAVEATSYFTISELGARVFYVLGDIRDRHLITRILQEHDVDYVFHLAAQPITPLSNQDPDNTISINVGGTQNICEAIVNANSKAKLILSSSACYYGLALSSPLREESAPNLRPGYSAYTKSKIMAEEIVSRYNLENGLESIICRFVNVYGPGDRHLSRIIPKTIKALIEGRTPTLSRSRGDSVFSFMYVDDAVSALLLSGIHATDFDGEVFNFGLLGDNPRNVLELVKTVFREGGAGEIEPLVECPVPEPRVVKYLDPSKAAKYLQWAPKTSINNGLRKTIAWEKQHNQSITYFAF